MAGTALGRVVLLASVAAFVAGCQGEGSPFGKRDKPGAAAPEAVVASQEASAEQADAPVAKVEKPAKAPTAKSVKLVDRDVEAHEVFAVTDMALWDGRRSLGGVWVASPDASDPERVILRNAANGKFVIGALFRRERDNPGPALQISSDAAAAVGLLAGQPGKIGVTALRREEAPVTAPDANKPILDAAETVDTETLDPGVAGATTAIETAETAPKKKAKGLGFFKKKQPKTDGPVAPVVSSQPLEAVAGNTTQAPPTSATPAPAKPASKAPTATAAKTPTAKAGVVQIGIFSVEANAKRAVDTLAKAGISAAIRQENAQGKAFWSVTAGGGVDTLGKVKAAGFGDAYMLKRG